MNVSRPSKSFCYSEINVTITMLWDGGVRRLFSTALAFGHRFGPNHKHRLLTNLPRWATVQEPLERADHVRHLIMRMTCSDELN